MPIATFHQRLNHASVQPAGLAFLVQRCARRLMPVLAIAVLAGCAALDEWPGIETGSDHDRRIEAGLREALKVGGDRAVSRLARVDGYFGVPDLRIPLPEDVQPLARRLEQFGLGRYANELELSMNRAAEQAAGEAMSVLSTSIASMRPADVQAILSGPDDAATQFLRQSAGPVLAERYQPIVASSLAQVQGYHHYQNLVSRWNRLPTGQPIDFDLETYVTDRALDGLFKLLAEEEQRIRRDPVARTTALLREIFG